MQGLYPPADRTWSKTSHYRTKYCFEWDIGRLTRLNMALVTGSYYIDTFSTRGEFIEATADL